MFSVAFTGYRPEKMPFCELPDDKNYAKFRAIQLKVIKRLIEKGATHFISGVAMGFDTWVAEDILELKRENGLLTLECAIPFPQQADNWPQHAKQRRKYILERSDVLTTVSDCYVRDAFFARNRYMVDCADVLVCAFDGARGGTAYTVDYALKKNKIIIKIDPQNADVSMLGCANFDLLGGKCL